ncbi:MAG: hypothetical protein LBJ76_00090, partial [Candidatus Accumulibacter sp.]|nr:hypothetical protein [Accumulibacter sp.]
MRPFSVASFGSGAVYEHFNPVPRLKLRKINEMAFFPLTAPHLISNKVFRAFILLFCAAPNRSHPHTGTGEFHPMFGRSAAQIQSFGHGLQHLGLKSSLVFCAAINTRLISMRGASGFWKAEEGLRLGDCG